MGKTTTSFAKKTKPVPAPKGKAKAATAMPPKGKPKDQAEKTVKKTPKTSSAGDSEGSDSGDAPEEESGDEETPEGFRVPRIRYVEHMLAILDGYTCRISKAGQTRSSTRH